MLHATPLPACNIAAEVAKIEAEEAAKAEAESKAVTAAKVAAGAAGAVAAVSSSAPSLTPTPDTQEFPPKVVNNEADTEKSGVPSHVPYLLIGKYLVHEHGNNNCHEILSYRSWNCQLCSVPSNQVKRPNS